MGHRNVSAAAHVPVKKTTLKIDNLEMIVREKKSSGDFMEGQSFAQKNVIHPARRIDIDLESRAGAAVKLINAVRRNRRRLMKFVRRDVFRQVGIDPKTYFGRANIRFDIREANFVFGEVVSKSSGANAFVARDAEIFVSGRAV